MLAIPSSTCHSRCAHRTRRPNFFPSHPRISTAFKKQPPFVLEATAKKSRRLAYSGPDLFVTENKATIERYMEGFRNSDHELVLSCLTDDVVWDIPGAFHIVGKDAFDREIENDAFVGKPAITVTRMTEENDVVVAEGSVRVRRKGGDFVNLVFCDVFIMRRAKIQRLISYLVPLDAAAPSAA